MWTRWWVAHRLGCGLHEGLLQSTNLWQCLCWRVALAECHDSAKVAEMQTATLYYAEGNHPCADIFFKDDTGALYLVDVGGTGNMSKALNKVQKMSDVLVKEGLREDLQVSKLRGVVLLPNIVSISLENEGIISEAITVTGARARELLGGLVQLLAWLAAVWSPELANLTRVEARSSASEKEAVQSATTKHFAIKTW